LNKKQNLALLVALLAIVMATPGCGVVNKLRAKNSLNEGVREFNKGKYQLAEEKFKHSLDLSPDMTNAQLFYARALNAQFDQSLTEDLGNRTIQSYEDIIKNNPNNYEAMDQSLAFEADVYDKMTRINADKANEFRQKKREAALRRADLPGATAKTKADVYYTLGVGYWQESYDLNAGYQREKRAIPPEVIEKMKPIIQKAHEYLQKAISVQPDYANAWFYEKLVYIEESKVDPTNIKKYDQLARQMQDKYTAIQKQQQASGGESSGS
jgi:tetratricopeptide (TPR) repeat protein